jgi:hypothetical protein
VDFFAYLDRAIPTRDSYRLYGFNWTIESRLLRQEIFGVFDQLHRLNSGWRNESGTGSKSQDLRTSIEMSSLQASLRPGAAESGKLLRAMLGEEESLLSLFGSL